MSMSPGGAHIELTASDRQLQQVSGRVKATMQRLQGSMERVGRVARNMLLVGGGAIAGFIKLASDQEQASRGLDAALRANGDNVDEWSKKLHDAASAIQAVTVHGDETTLAAMTMGRNLGIAADRMEEATRMAIGLSQVTGQDLNQSMRNVALAMSGNFQMLSRYIPALRGVTDATEGLRIVQDISAKGFEQAEEQAKTFSGQLQQLKNSLGDMGEELGVGFMPQLSRMVEGLREVLPVISDWVKGNQELIISGAGVSAMVLGLLVVLPKFVGMLTLIAAHPVVFSIVALTAALAGLAIAFNEGEIFGIRFGEVLGRIASQLGILRREVWQMVDAQRALEDAENRRREASVRLEGAQNNVQELAAIQAMIQATEDEIAARERLRQEHAKEAEAKRARITELEEFVNDDSLIKVKFDTPDFSSVEGFANSLPTKDPEVELKRLKDELQNIENLSIGGSAQVTERLTGSLEELRARAAALTEQIEAGAAAATNGARSGDGTMNMLEQLRQKAADVGKALRDGIAEAFRENQRGFEALMERIELFGETPRKQQLILLERQRKEMIEQARSLGRLTDEMEADINRRAEIEKQKILDEGDSGGGKSDDPAVQVAVAPVQMEGLGDVFRRIQEAAATPSGGGPEQRIADATERGAEAAERGAQANEDTNRRTNDTLVVLRQMRDQFTQLIEGLPLVGAYGA